MQIEREGLRVSHFIQRTDMFLQPLVVTVAVLAVFHPFDEFLPGTGDILPGVLHLEARDCIQPARKIDDPRLAIRLK